MRVSAFETGEGLSPRIETPHPALRATFSHKGRRKSPHPFGGASGCTISPNSGNASQRAAWALSAG